MDDEKFHRQCVELGIRNMFEEDHCFSICTLDRALEALDLPRGKDYKALQTIHCVHWTKMDMDFKKEIYNRCVNMLAAKKPKSFKVRFLEMIGF